MIVPIIKQQQKANQLINRIKDFPPLPAFINKILQLNADPDSSLKEICRVIEAEVALVTLILKLTNSSFFGLRHQVSSISHALAILGRNELINLVLASAMLQSFNGFKRRRYHIAALRLHCFQCGLIARYLTRKAGSQGGDLFIAGLVHDIGKAIIYLDFSEQMLEEMDLDHQAMYDNIVNEEEELGIDHATLGSRLLASWGFPETLQVAAKYHHQPSKAREHATYPLIIHAADTLLHTLNFRQKGGKKPADFCQNLLTAPINQLLCDAGIIITSENLNDLLDEVETKITQESDLAEMFG